MRIGAIRAWRVMLLVAGGAACLQAHPMGNYSVSHYTKIVVERDGARMDYVLDLAEIPTFELMRQWELDRNSPREALDRRAAQQAREWVSKLRLTVDGRAIAPRFVSATLAIEDGAGGVPVMRIISRLKLPVAAGKLEFEDANYTERAGWKEIVIAAADGAKIERSSHTDKERSQGLTAYPQDPTIAPPQDLRASVEWSAVKRPAVAAAPKPEPVATPAPALATGPTPPQADAPGTVVRGDYLSRMLRNREITLSMILIGMAVAFGLGSVHALSPGHGKTIVAAYLVGARGTWRHALFLGGMVTFTHTISVFFLGFVTLFLSEYVAPETLNPILAAISGISIVWIGAMLLIQRARRLRGHDDHDHHHGHDHDHHAHDHDHGHDHHGDHDHHHGPGGHTHVPEGDVSLGSLIALGASGGLVPCPSALVLLLSAISIQRVGLGMILLIAFSAGLAAVLSGIGLLVLYAKHLLPSSETTSRSMAFRVLPVVSAGVILCVGLVMTAVALGIIQPSRILG